MKRDVIIDEGRLPQLEALGGALDQRANPLLLAPEVDLFDLSFDNGHPATLTHVIVYGALLTGSPAQDQELVVFRPSHKIAGVAPLNEVPVDLPVLVVTCVGLKETRDRAPTRILAEGRVQLGTQGHQRPLRFFVHLDLALY